MPNCFRVLDKAKKGISKSRESKEIGFYKSFKAFIILPAITTKSDGSTLIGQIRVIDPLRSVITIRVSRTTAKRTENRFREERDMILNFIIYFHDIERFDEIPINIE